MEGISVSNVVMDHVLFPIQVTTFYMGRDRPEDIRAVDDGTPRYRGFLFSNIVATGARSAGAITGLREMPIEQITFSNVHLQAATGFTVTNARQITFLDTVVDTQKGPPLMLNNASAIETARFHGNTSSP